MAKARLQRNFGLTPCRIRIVKNLIAIQIMADSTYYIVIDGKQYDRKLIEIADKSVQGKGDGRISMEDAQELLAAVKDGNGYTDIEKATMEYIRDHYKFTDAADEWFRTEIRKWAATK